MRNILLILAALCMFGTASVSYAKDATSDSKDDVQQYIKMHQDMIKLHQDAISCVQSGKTVSDCMQQFRQSMMAKMKDMKANGQMMPGPMMQNRMKHQGGMMMQHKMMQNTNTTQN